MGGQREERATQSEGREREDDGIGIQIRSRSERTVMADDETEMKEKEARAVFVSGQLADKNTVWGTVIMPNNYLSDTSTVTLLFWVSPPLFPSSISLSCFSFVSFFAVLKIIEAAKRDNMTNPHTLCHSVHVLSLHT